MADPINYSLGELPDPTAAVTSGFKLGAGAHEMQLAQQAKQQALEQQKMMQQDFANLARNPTAEGIMQASIKYPSMSESLKRSNELLSDSEKASAVKDASQVYAALNSGKNDVAIQFLNEKADAYKNSGQEKKANALTTLAKSIELNPGTAKTTTGLFIAATDPKTFAENFVKLEGEQRSAEKAPAELLEAKAKAAKTAVEAQYIEKEKIADLEKSAVDLGLGKANTNKVIAETKKLGLEAAKAILELEAMKNGTTPPKEAFDFEEKLRKEYQSRTKGFDDAITQFDVIKASANDKSGAGDIALVTAFNKMLDPGSVVRETEFAASRDTAGLLTKLQNASKKVENGQFLDPKQRADFVRLAGEYYKAAERTTDSHKNVISNAVKNYKLNPDNVFGTTQRGSTLSASSNNQATVGGKTYARPVNFTDEQWAAYKQSTGAK